MLHILTLADLALAGIGLSVCAAGLLMVAHLWSPVYKGLPRSRWLGSALLVNLSAIQLCHYALMRHGYDLWSSRIFISQLFLTAPLFLFFCRSILEPDRDEPRWVWLLLIPAFLGLLFPGRVMFFVAYALGCTYFCVVTLELLRLRAQRSRFVVEMSALSLLICIAAMTLILGVLMPWLSDPIFFAGYSVLVAASFLPALYLVIRFPDIVAIAREVTELTRPTTLSNVNVDEKLNALEKLMRADKLFVNDDLSLAGLAQALELSTHQTSELLNRRLGVGFSPYLRQLRVNEAKEQLVAQPDASVLSIALSVGFSSQSSFYAAFREQEGVTPARFRTQAFRTPK